MRALAVDAQSARTGALVPLNPPDPEPRRGELRVRVRASGVCRTDLHLLDGELRASSLPRIPGHQIVGEVDAVGPEVSIPLGARVGIPWLYSACGRCDACLRGQENLCPSARFTGLDVDGGYAEYVLARSDFALRLPEAADPIRQAPLLCAGIIGYRSLRQAKVVPGERVGLFGFGASAHIALQILVHWGCEAYVFSRSPAHRRHALDLGARWAASAEEPPGEPLDAAVIFAPAGHLVPLALQHLRPGGRLAINAVYMSDLPSMPYSVIYGERSVVSVAHATRADGRELLELAQQIPIVTTVSAYPLKDANRALSDLRASSFNGQAVLIVD